MGSEGASGVTVHITGFKKFHGVSENPTETIVSNLKEFIQKNGSPHGLILGSFNVLDTAGVGALAKLYKILESAVVGRDGGGSSNNVIWLHLGVNSGVTRFAIENQAVNEATFRCPDELGWKPNKAPIVPSDGLITRTRESSLPVNEISNALAKKGYAVSPSDDAGRFVCNYVYYHSLRFAEQHGIKSLFVHVPLFTTINEETQMQFVASLLELENYVKTEEAKVEELIKAVAESGANVVVSGAAVGDMALHFCERYKLMVLKVSSKFELRRLCRTTCAVALLKLSQRNPYELGFANSVSVEEIGGSRVTVVKSEEGGNSVSTVILRGSTDSILDDLERAVDDGVNTYKAMCRDSRIVPGAAATEIELARKLKEFSFKETGLDQYAIAKFAESFELVPRTLSENAGLNAMEIISSLYAEHAAGNTKVGIDLDEGACKDASVMNIWDLHVTKFFALKYAADAACTVLRVDQIIMARPAGGPNPRANQPMDED